MNHLSSNTLYVISAFKGNNTKADITYQNELEAILNDKGDDFIRSEARRDGKEIEVFVLSAPSGVGNDIVKATLLELADCFNQEYITEIDSNNAGMYSHYLNGEAEYSGKFHLRSDKPDGDYILINGLHLSLVNWLSLW